MGPEYQRLELDEQLCFSLYAASRAVVRAYGPLLADLGLTYPQYVALLVLWEDPERSATVGDLGERLHLDSGTLTPLLKRLEVLGHVTRTRDTADERRVLVALTPRGLALRDGAVTVPVALLARTGLELAEARDLRDRLSDLVEVLEAAPRP